MTENLTFTRIDAHNITVLEDGKQIKYVPESDLLTVKEGSERVKADYEAKITKHLTDLAEANRLRDEVRQTLLQEQAKSEGLEKNSQEAATWKSKVGEA